MRLKNLYIILLISFSFSAWSQNPALANKYFEEGEFEKAIVEYKSLLDKFPYNNDYALKLIRSYQALSKYDEVTKLIESKQPKRNPKYWVYLGYNYQLQKDSVKAQKYYQKAIKAVKKKGHYAYSVGNAFKNFYLLDEALQVYQTAMKDNNKNNFYMQMALIYAEKNDIPKMIENFLELYAVNPSYQSQVKYYLTRFITQDPENKANIVLKEQLIDRISQTQDAQWYRLLYWLYMQQKEYKKAFLQLKSLYRKQETEISEIFQLAKTASFAGKDKTATAIYHFIIQENGETYYIERSKLELLKISTKNILNEEQKKQIQHQFETYLSENWSLNNKLALQILYADFLAFHLQNDTKALQILDELSQKYHNKKQQAEIRLKKADILMYEGLFNQALILYTQVQVDFPNHPLGHKATYKIARASFFQGDINWAHSQLKVIKSVADDLIANDAIQLDVLIINNKEENDSLQTGLKKLARAKFEIFRKKTNRALQILDSLKQNFKGQLIYDDALWTQAQLYEQQQKYDLALENYQAILDNKTEDLYKDDALYKMAEIYETQLFNEAKAKELYKKIVIEYPGSFWFIPARKHYRKLRGDAILN